MKTTVLLIPGLLCDNSIWTHQILELCEKNAVLCPNLSSENSIPNMAKRALQLADGPLSIAGHSLGGRIALEIYKQAPERVSRLALLNTGIHPAKPHEQDSRMQLVNTAKTEGMAQMAKEWLPPMMHDDFQNDAALMNQLTKMIERATPESFERQQQALLNRPDPTETLPKISCPTLLVSGDGDKWSPPAQHKDIQSHIRGSQFFIVPGAGHMSLVEQPDMISILLQCWLKDDLNNSQILPLRQ